MSPAISPKGSSETYLEKIDSIYSSSTHDWLVQEGGEEAPELWLLPLQISTDILKGAATELARDISFRRTQPYQKARCVFLLYLLKTRLSNAQANRFWPAVSDGIADLANEEISRTGVPDYFRTCLNSVYRAKLGSIKHYFKYVYLCFAESGAGADRTRLIREFFHHLIDSYQGGLSSHDRIVLCDALLEEHIRNNEGEKADIQSLSGLMQRSGYQLLAIADELRARPDLITIRHWGWEKLRAFWRNRADVDLERLLPEAQDVFLGMLPAIAASITRYQARKLIRDGQVFVVQPEAAGQPDSEDLSTIAVGPVLIKDRAGETTESLVIDNTGLNTRRIMGYPEGHWAEVADRYLIWRQQFFEVLSFPWRRESATPMFREERFNNFAKPIAWFWTSEKNPESVPVDCKTGNSPKVEAKIHVSHRWFMAEGRLSFSVNSFRLAHSSIRHDCHLQVAQEKIWWGEIADHSWIKIDKTISLKDPRQDVEVCMVCKGKTIASRVFANPIAGGAAMFFGRLCGPEIFLNGSDLHRVWLICDEDLGTPKATGFEVKSAENRSLTAAGLSAYQFTISNDVPESRWISIGHRKWTVRVGPFAELVSGLPYPLEYEGVRFVSTGAMHPISRKSDFRFAVDVPPNCVGALSDTNQLVIDSAGRKLAINLSDILDGERPAGRTDVSLLTLMDQRRFVPDTGVISISLRGPNVSPFIGIETFFIDGEVSIASCAIGMRSKLSIQNEGGTEFAVTASNATGLDKANGDVSKARALISLREDEQLWVTWRPKVCDVVVFAGSNPVNNDRIELFCQDKNFQLTQIGNVDGNYILRVNEEFERPFTENNIDIQDLLAEFQPHFPKEMSETQLTVIDLTKGTVIRTWIVDITPTIKVSATHWTENVGGSTLVVHYQAIGLKGEEIHFGVLNSGTEQEAEKAVKIIDIQECKLEIPWTGSLYKEDFTLVVTGCGVELARASLPESPEWSEPTTEILRNRVKTSIQAWHSETSHAMQLVCHYDKYVAMTGTAPWPAMKISNKICENGMSRIEELVTNVLLFLEYIALGREVDFYIGKLSVKSPLDLILATLALGEQIRLSKNGLMVPSMVGDLRQTFVFASAKNVKKYWSDAMIQACDSLDPKSIPKAASAIQSQIKAALSRPLVLADKGLLEVLEKLLDGQENDQKSD